MRITVEKEIIMTQLDDETILLNIKNGRYFSLNKTGVRVWELLQQHKEVEEVLSILLDEYDVDGKILWQDIENLILRLSEAELVNLK